MSSNHKAPLAAFVVVAIACVVVLATSSMRSYAKDAWHTLAAPVVAGLELIEIKQGETLQPVKPTASPAAKRTGPSEIAHSTVLQSADAATARPPHGKKAGADVIPAAVHHQPKKPTAMVDPVVTPAPAPSVPSTVPTVSSPAWSGAVSHGGSSSKDHGWWGHSGSTEIAAPITVPSAHGHAPKSFGYLPGRGSDQATAPTRSSSSSSFSYSAILDGRSYGHSASGGYDGGSSYGGSHGLGSSSHGFGGSGYSSHGFSGFGYSSHGNGHAYGFGRH